MMLVGEIKVLLKVIREDVKQLEIESRQSSRKVSELELEFTTLREKLHPLLEVALETRKAKAAGFWATIIALFNGMVAIMLAVYK